MLDQSGDPIAGTVSWSISGGGSISPASGPTTTFSSDGTLGQFAITASCSGVEQAETVTVSDPSALHLRVNCGSSAYVVAGWESDDTYMSGGSDYTFGNTSNTTAVANAAPPDVYKSVVHYAAKGTSHYYDFAGLPNGAYTVRMHFSDGAAKTRSMNYTFEGAQLITALDIVGESGGADIPLVKDVTVTVADGNGLQIECFGTDDSDVFEAGIEVIGQGAAPASAIMVSAVHTGQSYSVGETIVINWDATADVGDVVIEVTPDDGESWVLVTGEESIAASDANWGAYKWLIPSSIDGVDLASPSVRLRITDYVDASIEGVSGAFEIVGSGAVNTVRQQAGARRVSVTTAQGDLVLVDIVHRGDYQLGILNLRGELVHSTSGSGPGQARWLGAGAGTYILVLRAGANTSCHRITLGR